MERIKKMKIVMLEPLGISEAIMEQKKKIFTNAGHEFTDCGRRLSHEEKLDAAKDADIFMIANSPLTADIINAAPNLKMISVGFTGVDHVDMALCAEKNITVCNAQGYATDSTAELTISLMLACLRNIVPYDQVVRNGGTLAGYTHNTLRSKTVGVIGTGAIGCKVASLAKSFGCRVLGYSRSQNPEALKIGVEYQDIDSIFSESDIVTLHAPLTEATRNIASKTRIDSMKKTAILINCARGPLVDSKALADALNEGRIAKAGIDVFETEPPIDKNHPLLAAKNIILTPHVGFYAEESLAQRINIVCDNITAWLAGKPINVVK